MERFRVVTLEELKQQMHVDFEDENDIISLYGVTAEDRVISGTRRSVEELNLMGYIEQNGEPENTAAADEAAGDILNFPKSLKLAILMLAAHFYRNREPVASIAQNCVPMSYEALVKPYRKLTDRVVDYVTQWKANREGADS